MRKSRKPSDVTPENWSQSIKDEAHEILKNVLLGNHRLDQEARDLRWLNFRSALVPEGLETPTYQTLSKLWQDEEFRIGFQMIAALIDGMNECSSSANVLWWIQQANNKSGREVFSVTNIVNGLDNALEEKASSIIDRVLGDSEDDYRSTLKVIEAAECIGQHIERYGMTEIDISVILIALKTIAQCQLMIINEAL